jgi:hypothetical protein
MILLLLSLLNAHSANSQEGMIHGKYDVATVEAALIKKIIDK